MNYLRTPPEFDYDLWSTDDRKYFVRIKSTGEETEVSPDVMRYLRSEEKALRRFISTSLENPILSLSTEFMSDAEPDTSAPLSPDTIDFFLTKICIEEIRDSLTDIQRDVFDVVMVGGMSCHNYARLNDLHFTTVTDHVRAIRKIFQKKLSTTPTKFKKMSVV